MIIYGRRLFRVTSPGYQGYSILLRIAHDLKAADPSPPLISVHAERNGSDGAFPVLLEKGTGFALVKTRESALARLPRGQAEVPHGDVGLHRELSLSTFLA